MMVLGIGLQHTAEVLSESVEMTAKELRSKAGAALACVDRGEAVTVTCRGKPKARLVGMEQGLPTAGEEERMPAFGMWRDRDDIADIDAYVRNLRKGCALVG